MALSITDQDTGEFVRIKTVSNGDGTVSISVGGVTISGGVSIGDVTVANFPANQTISGFVRAEVSNYPATQTISGFVRAEITNSTSLQTISGFVRAEISNPVAIQTISGFTRSEVTNYPAIQTVSGHVVVDNFPAIQTVSGFVTLQNNSYLASQYTLSGVETALGSEGANPPSIVGSGIMKYVRGTYEALANNPISVVVKDSTGDSVMDDANNALRVNIVAGTIGADTVYTANTISYVPASMSTSGYVSGDVMGAVKDVANVMKGTIPHVYVNQIALITGAGNATFAARMHFFNDNPTGTTFTDNSVITIASSDRTKYVGFVDCSRTAVGGVGVLTPISGGLPLMIAHATNTSFWTVVECRGTVDLPDSSNLRVTMMLAY